MPLSELVYVGETAWRDCGWPLVGAVSTPVDELAVLDVLVGNETHGTLRTELERRPVLVCHDLLNWDTESEERACVIEVRILLKRGRFLHHHEL